MPALTVDGQITGTLQYMAPEQLQGKDADARSDIFSFGCVLYEMLSGAQAFSGSSAASVIAAILEREPEPLKMTPPLDRVIRTCLAKDPDERFQNPLDLKRNLLWALESPGDAVTSRVRWPWVATAAMALIALAALLYAFRPTNAPAPETRVDIVTPPTDAPTSFALSPDGRKIAYVASGDGPSRLWVRSLDTTSSQPLPGTEGALNPFWSPDSRSLGFFADQKLKRIDLAGGQPQNLADAAAANIDQGTWSAEGTILFTTTTAAPLSRVPASGGKALVATKLGRGQIGHHSPRFLSGGRRFLFYAIGADSAIWLGSLDGTEPRRITALVPGTESAAEYLVPGWLLRVRQGILAAQRFDASRGQLSSDPVPLAHGGGHRSKQAGWLVLGVAFRDDRLADRWTGRKATDLVQSLRTECGHIRHAGRIQSIGSRTLSRRQTGGNHAWECGFARPLDTGGRAPQPVHLRPRRRLVRDLVARRQARGVHVRPQRSVRSLPEASRRFGQGGGSTAIGGNQAAQFLVARRAIHPV